MPKLILNSSHNAQTNVVLWTNIINSIVLRLICINGNDRGNCNKSSTPIQKSWIFDCHACNPNYYKNNAYMFPGVPLGFNTMLLSLKLD